MKSDNKILWRLLLGALLLIYVVLTTLIFIYKEKIKVVDQQLMAENKTKYPKGTNKSKTKYNKQEHENEVKKLETKLQKTPEDADAHFTLAQSYMQNKSTQQKALRHLQKTIELNNKHPQKKIIELWIKKLRNSQ
ncbi:tetratricopeptide repeat protein [Candidatus Uabimicrobium sp. HlEnr_7]|uniref:tetratricopeptide repeat protein n=1 Tax=Candidatus Uabimicrobium helgolandensis TaxID=3095367 RepID=UPI0035561733